MPMQWQLRWVITTVSRECLQQQGGHARPRRCQSILLSCNVMIDNHDD